MYLTCVNKVNVNLKPLPSWYGGTYSIKSFIKSGNL